MFLFIAIVLLVVSAAWFLFTAFAQGMADAPVPGFPPGAWLSVVGAIIAVIMIVFRIIGFYPR